MRRRMLRTTQVLEAPSENHRNEVTTNARLQLPRPSACVPAFRRLGLLPSCAVRIMEEGEPFQTPLFVTDDASVDTNSDVVETLRQRYPQVIHALTEQTLGIGRTVLQRISECTCGYARAIGEDDRMRSEATDKVLGSRGRPPDESACLSVE